MARVSDPRWPTFGRDVPDAAWRPAPDAASATRLGRFVRAAGVADIEALQARAAVDPAWFWGAAAEDIGLAWQRRPQQVLDTSAGVEWSRWWGGGAFNYAAAAIEPRAGTAPDQTALSWEGEDGTIRQLSSGELRDETLRAAAMLTRLGVRAGDRVGIFLPLLPETVVSVLALGLLRAIYVPIF
jgi:acetyl-CoA synthetase